MGAKINRIGRALTLSVGAFSFLASTPALAAKQPQQLARSSKWLMDYDKDACRLAAAFGADHDSVTVFFSRFEPGDSFFLDVAGERFNLGPVEPKVTVEFGPGYAPQAFTPTLGANGKTPMLLGLRLDLMGRSESTRTKEDPPPLTPDQEAAVTYVVIRSPGRTPARLELGSMRAPMRAMRACMDDLVRTWGLDPTVQASLSRRATPLRSPGEWLRSADYPGPMMFKGNQALVQFRLEVDELGAVTNCHIQGHTKPEGFADLTCKLIIKRAKFQPALDAAGKPAKSYYVNRVHWLIPD